jgi:sec-independent protein translocase protein TatC
MAAASTQAADAYMTVGEHIQEFRTRCIRLVIVSSLLFFASLTLAERILEAYVSGLGQVVVASSPTDVVSSVFYMAVLLTGVFALPLISYEAYMYVSPVIPKKILMQGGKLLMASLALSLTGLVVGYYITAATIDIMAQMGEGLGIINLWNVYSVIDFYVMSMLLFVVVFQIPLLMRFLNRSGLVAKKSFCSLRKYILFAALVLVAVISPQTDALSLIVTAIPIGGLYEVGIWMS